MKLPRSLPEEDYQFLLDQISADLKDRVGRFYRRDDALRTLCADIVVRTAASSALGVSNDELVFESTPTGKPFLKSSNFHFNKSHAGDWIVCGFDQSALGVDVETVQEVDPTLAKSVLSDEEYGIYLAKPEVDRSSFFFSMWTLKESYIKADGRGLSLNLNSFSILIEGREFRLRTENELQRCWFQTWELSPTIKIAICRTSATPFQTVTEVSFDEILEKFRRLV